MLKVKIGEIKKMKAEELLSKLKELRLELIKLRGQKARGTLENPMAIRNVRKDIARILTVLNERKRVGDGG